MSRGGQAGMGFCRLPHARTFSRMEVMEEVMFMMGLSTASSSLEMTS
jgi:hypothetical protein